MDRLSNAISVARIICMFRIISVNYFPHIFNKFYGVSYVDAVKTQENYMSIMNQNTWFIDKVAYFLTYSGWSAVVAFTILSGFSLWLSVKKSGTFTLSSYIQSRLTRIYIPYLIIVFVAYFMSNSHGIFSMSALIGVASRYNSGAYDLDVPLWFKSAIFICYLVFPLIVIIYKYTKTVGIILVAIACFVASVLTANTNSEWYPLFPFVFFMVVGIALAEIVYKLKSKWIIIASVILIPVCSLVYLWINYIEPSSSVGENWNLVQINGVPLSGFVLLGLTGVILFMSIGYLLPKMWGKWLIILSRGTFTVFLVHYLLVPGINKLALMFNQHLSVFLVGIYIAMLIGLSCYQWVIDRLVVNKIKMMFNTKYSI